MAPIVRVAAPCRVEIMDLICGINPVLEALNAGSRHFDRLLIAKGVRNQRIAEAISKASGKGVPLRFESRETLDRMAGSIPHQGLIAVVSAKPVMSLEALLERAHAPGMLVVLDGVEDPRNLGAILRTAEAAGADGVVLPERHSAGLSETVSRASAGGLEHVNVARVGNVAQSLEALKARGYWVVGLDAAGTERWDAVDYRRSVALVLGGEGRGIRRLVRERCDHLVSIPLFGHVASLNVSVAAAIALYEVVRQRGNVPSHVRPIPVRAAGAQHVVGPSHADRERDPGQLQRFTDEPEEETMDDGEPERLRVLGDHDEAAWALPTVVKAVGHLRHGGSSHAAQTGGGGGREDLRGHGRRRRGRHGPRPGERQGPGPGPPGGAGPPSGPGTSAGPRLPAGPAEGGGSATPTGGGTAPPGAPAGPRGPHRRRRRRRR
jgi:23S rRNA (guanosine2251-2'-O)-methyltransferase